MVVVIILVVLAKLPTTQATDLYGYKCSSDSHWGGADEEATNSSNAFAFYGNIGSILTEASRTGFDEVSYGKNRDQQLFILYMCRGDIDGQGCQNCVAEAIYNTVGKCIDKMEAVIWYDHCMIRFSPESFFGRMDDSPSAYFDKPSNVSSNQFNQFERVLSKTIPNLIQQAANGDKLGKKFATQVAIVDPLLTLYALAQCTPDLANTECRQCLMTAVKQMEQQNRTSTGFFSTLPSCNFRYDINRFFNQTSSLPGKALPLPLPLPLPPPPSSTEMNPIRTSQSRKMKHRLLRISIFAISISMTTLLGVGILICSFRSKKKAPETCNKLEINEIRTVNSLQFDLIKIRVATRNFSPDNKLGEGGFGEVYKGILEDGQEIAIKRLSKNSGQGVEEFKTEVDLVAKLQHKNLVRLLGFCLSSTEKILVYEFLQNSSLDQYIFDAKKKASLDWETRYKLMVGIGRGLLYLHEDSRLKIIHRDLKPSNILLDEGMNPKISDFGLAKLFGADQTQGDTKRIVGTYGYMAPEYAITGHFSVKSDVYSFGIIVLEIVSGQRNRFYGQQQVEEALLHRAWRLWNEGNALDLVDTALANNYPREVATKCIHIALLCIQENATERPRMATVVAALSGQSISLPMPRPPDFFGNITTTHGILSEIEYRQVLDQQNCPYVYSGTETITDDLYYPR